MNIQVKHANKSIGKLITFEHKHVPGEEGNMHLKIVIFKYTSQNQDLHGTNVTFLSTLETFYFMRSKVL